MGTRLVKLSVIFFLPWVLMSKMSAAEEDDPPPIYLQYVDEVVHAFEHAVQKDLGLIAIGSGGSMPYNVREIDVMLSASQKSSVSQARELQVLAEEKLLNMINAHEKLRPYLEEYPFPAKRVVVSIAFYKPDGSHYTDGSVAYVSPIRGKIFYRSASPQTQRLVDLHEEPYEEALKIVQDSPPKRMQ